MLLLFCFLPLKVISLTDRNEVNNTVNDFHNILKQLSGNYDSGLIKTVPKRDPSPCKDISDEEFFKFITNSINPSQYLSQSVLSQFSGRYSDDENEQQNVPTHQSIDRQLWSLDEAEYMFVVLGGGLSE